jgi:hypothetical protein
MLAVNLRSMLMLVRRADSFLCQRFNFALHSFVDLQVERAVRWLWLSRRPRSEVNGCASAVAGESKQASRMVAVGAPVFGTKTSATPCALAELERKA